MTNFLVFNINSDMNATPGKKKNTTFFSLEFIGMGVKMIFY